MFALLYVWMYFVLYWEHGVSLSLFSVSCILYVKEWTVESMAAEWLPPWYRYGGAGKGWIPLKVVNGVFSLNIYFSPDLTYEYRNRWLGNSWIMREDMGAGMGSKAMVTWSAVVCTRCLNSDISNRLTLQNIYCQAKGVSKKLLLINCFGYNWLHCFK